MLNTGGIDKPNARERHGRDPSAANHQSHVSRSHVEDFGGLLNGDWGRRWHSETIYLFRNICNPVFVKKRCSNRIECLADRRDMVGHREWQSSAAGTPLRLALARYRPAGTALRPFSVARHSLGGTGSRSAHQRTRGANRVARSPRGVNPIQCEARAIHLACQHGSPKNSREASPPLRATATPRQEDSLLPGHTPVTLLSRMQRDKGTKAKGSRFEPADAA